MRGQCANAWSICKCANVQMCKCANGRFNLLRFIACKCFSLQMLFVANTQLYKGDNLHICTFSHLHINQAFAH